MMNLCLSGWNLHGWTLATLWKEIETRTCTFLLLSQDSASQRAITGCWFSILDQYCDPKWTYFLYNFPSVILRFHQHFLNAHGLKSWLPASWCYWKVVETPLGSGVWWKEMGLLEMCTWRAYWVPGSSISFCFLAAMSWAVFFYHVLLSMMFCLTTSPKAMEPTHHSSSETLAKINFFFLKLNFIR